MALRLRWRLLGSGWTSRRPAPSDILGTVTLKGSACWPAGRFIVDAEWPGGRDAREDGVSRSSWIGFQLKSCRPLKSFLSLPLLLVALLSLPAPARAASLAEHLAAARFTQNAKAPGY